MTAPAWLDRAALGRAARRSSCPRCGAATINGLDADWCALEVHADPQPVDALGELLALTAGRTTYDLVTTKDRAELHERRPEHVNANPAGNGRWPVHPTHTCGATLPAAATRPAADPRPTSITPEF